LFTEKQSHS